MASINWKKLEILNKSQKGDNGRVEFNAFYLNAHGETDVQNEISIFKRIDGIWFYVGGHVS